MTSRPLSEARRAVLFSQLASLLAPPLRDIRPLSRCERCDEFDAVCKCACGYCGEKDECGCPEDDFQASENHLTRFG